MHQRKKGVSILLPLIYAHPRLAITSVLVGFAAALSEGIGITLFVPLLGALSDPDSNAATQISPLFNLYDDWLDEHVLVVSSLLVALAITIKAVLTSVNDVCFSRISSRIGHELRRRLFAHFMRLPYEKWEAANHDKMYNALASETWRTSDAVSTLIKATIISFTALVYLSLLFLISAILAITVLAVMGILAFLFSFASRKVKAIGAEATAANTELMHQMVEGFDGMTTIRTFSREKESIDAFEKISQRVRKIFNRLAIYGASVNPVYEAVSAYIFVGIILTASLAETPLPSTIIFAVVLFRLQPKIQALDACRMSLASQAAAIEEIQSILEVPTIEQSDSTAPAFHSLKDSIQFQNVSFRYTPQDPAVLEQVNFGLQQSKVTALVGPSGAGKTTIVKLLLRLYQPDSGTILIDGSPLDSFQVESWRERVAVVSQDIYLFNSSIRDNIRYACPHISNEEIEQAAKLADAHTFITSLPHGYDTKVGDRGARLSGGQAQKLSLARAIAKKADFIILDEPTSALDGKSENTIGETIRTLADQNATILLITHRLSTARVADQAISIDHGKVIDQGPISRFIVSSLSEEKASDEEARPTDKGKSTLW
ncbi:ABC transporter ATP-binding protein [Pelagicoccus sp. SDUM812002]|uniref:ABC transporter ATP-binding protein n=1 Tax=Pelagicoccus sp. SDUM812002 TaxID=3041266 RepID=UPI00280E46C0|nr:ABC transporter ATP-binding protein [Pelagicoccus sp. SDUM812002]